MFAYDLTGVQRASGTLTTQPVTKAKAQTFREVLFQETTAQGMGGAKTPSASEAAQAANAAPGLQAGQVLGASSGNVDPQDEDEALKEMFHLVAMLSVGIVDGDMVKAHENDGVHDAGPARQAVERLKEVIRKLMRGGGDDAKDEVDPVTGKPKPGHGSGSLSALFQSLPTELQNLLRKAFPNVDDLMQKEMEKAMKEKQKG